MVKRFHAFAIVFTILFGIGLTERTEARTEVTLDVFYEALSPYGEWIEHRDLGYIWQPAGVDEYWQPYRDGNWQYSNEGWIWVSNEPWGWATYHYGRWVPDEYYGWVWIPGVTWAPSYVEWYDSPGYIGWTPRPPDKNFFLEIGLSSGGLNYLGLGYSQQGYYGPGYYNQGYYNEGYYGSGYSQSSFAFNFSYYKPYKKYYKNHHHNKHHYYPRPEHCVYVPYKDFGHRNPKFAAIGNHNTIVYRNTTNITNVQVVNNKTVYKGPDRHYVEERAGRKIKRVDVVDKNKVVYRGGRDLNSVKGDKYEVYRPRVIKKGNERPKNISKRTARSGDYQKRYNDNPSRSSLVGSDSHSLVNKRGNGYKQAFNAKDGYRKNGNHAYGNNRSLKKEKSNTDLAPGRTINKSVNRKYGSAGDKNGYTKSYDKNYGNKSGVDRHSQKRQYQKRQDPNRLGREGSYNSVGNGKYKPRNLKNQNSFKAQKGFNKSNRIGDSRVKSNFNKASSTQNKSLKRYNNRSGQARYNTQANQKGTKTLKHRNNSQKSFKQKNSAQRVNNSYSNKSYSKNKASSKPNQQKSYQNSLNRSSFNSQKSFGNSGRNSMNRQVRR